MAGGLATSGMYRATNATERSPWRRRRNEGARSARRMTPDASRLSRPDRPQLCLGLATRPHRTRQCGRHPHGHFQHRQGDGEPRQVVRDAANVEALQREAYAAHFDARYTTVLVLARRCPRRAARTDAAGMLSVFILEDFFTAACSVEVTASATFMGLTTISSAADWRRIKVPARPLGCADQAEGLHRVPLRGRGDIVPRTPHDGTGRCVIPRRRVR